MEMTVDRILISLAQKVLLVEALEAELQMTREILATTKAALTEAQKPELDVGPRIVKG